MARVLPKLAADKFLSQHETAGEEFPSRLEAKSSGQRVEAGGTFSQTFQPSSSLL